MTLKDTNTNDTNTKRQICKTFLHKHSHFVTDRLIIAHNFHTLLKRSSLQKESLNLLKILIIGSAPRFNAINNFKLVI